ncbi:polysaccharide deacetylase family protein [Vibrio sp. SCSIO 43132]|uniref:polysaccharide deacetylase family protein n=1 Tax=Vibrio sp. SCSIO 43132 TaxID=2779363 RepID=UPI00223B92BB|nr:polysaccharide deacetylase family protein [Vibrio sp. SCSIO 43132]
METDEMKREGQVKKIIASILILFSVAVGLWQLSKARSYQLFGDIISEVRTSEKVIALTFDDGPWNQENTARVLATLNEYGVKATFYLNGRGIKSNLQAAKHIVLDGHEIGNHGYTHNRLVLKSVSEIEQEIESTNELIRSIGYSGEITFRPPYGSKLFTLPYYLNQNGITTVTWNIEPETYPDIAKSPSSIAKHINEQAAPGSIILLHVFGSNNEVSRQSLPLVIEGLIEQGYQFVTVSELLRLDG